MNIPVVIQSHIVTASKKLALTAFPKQKIIITIQVITISSIILVREMVSHKTVRTLSLDKIATMNQEIWM